MVWILEKIITHPCCNQTVAKTKCESKSDHPRAEEKLRPRLNTGKGKGEQEYIANPCLFLPSEYQSGSSQVSDIQILTGR